MMVWQKGKELGLKVVFVNESKVVEEVLRQLAITKIDHTKNDDALYTIEK